MYAPTDLESNSPYQQLNHRAVLLRGSETSGPLPETCKTNLVLLEDQHNAYSTVETPSRCVRQSP